MTERSVPTGISVTFGDGTVRSLNGRDAKKWWEGVHAAMGFQRASGYPTHLEGVAWSKETVSQETLSQEPEE